MKKRVKTVTKEELIHRARLMGGTIMMDLLENCPTAEQMTTRIFTLEMIAIHILATCIYNYEERDKQNPDEVFHSFMTDINAEVDFIKNTGQIERIDINAAQVH